MREAIYLVIPLEEITIEVLNYSTSRRTEHVRISVDGTKGIIKIPGEVPSILMKYQQYNHKEIMEEIKKPDWVPSEEPPEPSIWAKIASFFLLDN